MLHPPRNLARKVGTPPVNLWNHRVRGKFASYLGAATRRGENLEKKASFKVSKSQSFKDFLMPATKAAAVGSQK